MTNVLDKITSNKVRELIHRKALFPLEKLQSNLVRSERSLFEALSKEKAGFILECKKASPSKGLIRKDFNLTEIISSYKKYASAISILTDYKYFKGSFEYLKKVREQVHLPLLCKDFFVDPYQVFEARYYGADAILLMLSILTDEQYRLLSAKAKELSLDVLTEVHDAVEMERALSLNAKIIGINNRNLKDLSIDLDTTKRLIESLSDSQKEGRVFISESGISSHHDVREINPLVDGFLVGSSIMDKENIEQQCKSLIFGKTKICGLSKNLTAQVASDSGATYGGLIFHPKSPRYVSLEQAKSVIKGVDLEFVGVFVNESIESIVNVVKHLSLPIVQLHGSEDQAYITKLKKALPTIRIWKAIPIESDTINGSPIKQNEKSFELLANGEIERFVFDTSDRTNFGGSGKTFDWARLPDTTKDKIILAGGLSRENILDAIQTNCFALDVNSGVESAAGVKSEAKIKSLFQTLHV
ncbi:MAG: bifunctional indole-3-glycerol-phosphate synthase TrpC/phosphoribosylanthranilate isomerase TrpF [Kangiellaceae bacterium]|nr:bifunctional indole-3-glycerol-phosphate synthase TrpC/phosphoribosylanthranilate isomerase TrpF [Kangiellaceae bacterium]